MAATIQWIVLRKEHSSVGATGSVAIAAATTIVAVIDNKDGTVTVYFV